MPAPAPIGYIDLLILFAPAPFLSSRAQLPLCHPERNFLFVIPTGAQRSGGIY